VQSGGQDFRNIKINNMMNPKKYGLTLIMVLLSAIPSFAQIEMLNKDGITISYRAVLQNSCSSLPDGWEPNIVYYDVYVWTYYITITNNNGFNITVDGLNVSLTSAKGMGGCNALPTATSTGFFDLNAGDSFTTENTGYTNTEFPPKPTWSYGGYQRK
jgi:hypothetical protein